MNCSICQRSHDAKKLPFYCAVDARNRLYKRRIEIVDALTRNEEIERKVNATLAAQVKEGQDRDSFEPRARMDLLKSEEQTAIETTSRIIEQAGRLKAEIDAARKEIEQKKEKIARRKSDFSSTSVGSSARKSRLLEETQRSTSRLRYKWNNIADTMAGTRAFLCEEAARLYGLRQVKKGSTRRYEIGGVEIVELHAMNGVSPEVISTSLAHIAHILVLASHYLAIRLPAQITLPHRDYPRPTIFTLNSSYRHDDVPFPGSAPIQIISADEGEAQRTPRARPLYLDRPLPTLAKEDPQAYSLFLEGVSLLAYNIVWACCSQGVSVGDKDSFEDICNMGQNLWRLLIGEQLHRRSVEPTFPLPLVQASSGAGSPKNDGNGEMTKSKSLLGRWSHGTMFAFLGGAEGSEFVRGFKILAPMKLVDKLKKRLSSEAPLLEWETIEGDELDDGYQSLSAGRAAAHDLGVESIMTVRTSAGTNSTYSNKYSDKYNSDNRYTDNNNNKYFDKNAGGFSNRYSNNAGHPDHGSSTAAAGTTTSSKGTSGWTKLKSRYDGI
ncbi:UV radiation resistance protein and autophagy-related subunit 14 domain containing protein [Naviculisporaceae sp. PSN 640]